MARLPYRKTKKEVDYHLTEGADHCSVCEHYVKPNACEKVLGFIAEKGWCEFFRRRAK